VRFLKESIALDPEFTYALDDLRALERRLNRYRDDAADLADARARAALALLKDPAKTADEKAKAVMEMFGAYQGSFRWEASLAFATAVYPLPLAPGMGLDPHELASFQIFFAHQMLKHTDLALQAGERHLEEFPGTALSNSVEASLRNIIDDRRRLAEANAGVAAKLQEIDDDEAALAAKQRAEVPPGIFGFRRCSAYYQGRQYLLAVERCRAWGKEHPSSDAQHLDELARYFAALSLAELGRFDEARAELLQLQQEDETWARGTGIPSFLNLWPRD
jgi:hypothetical protein